MLHCNTTKHSTSLLATQLYVHCEDKPLDQKQVASSYECFSKALLANGQSFLTQTVKMNGCYRRFKTVREQLQQAQLCFSYQYQGVAGESHSQR